MTKEQLKLELKNLGVSCDVDKLEELMAFTLAANEKFNLTAIKDEDKFRELMILDSLVPCSLLGELSNKTILDIGTGAGFPGLPIALANLTARLTLLDSTKKKIDHINGYISSHNINNVIAIHGRAEELITNKRESFDYVIARAVSSLNILLEICLPFVKVGGTFIAMKGAKANEEIEQSKRALALLGAEIVSINRFVLPISGEVRYNVLIKKTKQTNKKYPREYKDIVNKPL